jgi:hypothetical protein
MRVTLSGRIRPPLPQHPERILFKPNQGAGEDSSEAVIAADGMVRRCDPSPSCEFGPPQRRRTGRNPSANRLGNWPRPWRTVSRVVLTTVRSLGRLSAWGPGRRRKRSPQSACCGRVPTPTHSPTRSNHGRLVPPTCCRYRCRQRPSRFSHGGSTGPAARRSAASEQVLQKTPR